MEDGVVENNFPSQEDVPDYLSIVEEEKKRREEERRRKEEKRKEYCKMLESAFQQVIQIISRADIDHDLKKKVVLKFAQDFPKNCFLSKPEIGRYLPDFTPSFEVSGPESGLGIYVNGSYIGKKSPSTIEAKIGDIVYVEDISKGAWVVQGNEKYIRFRRKDAPEGSILYAIIGNEYGPIGYALRESITQEEFDNLATKANKIRVISARDCWHIKSINSLEIQTGLWALDVTRTKIFDIKVLSNLKELRFLNLRETSISDLSPLSKLTELRWLSLWRTPVCDLSPLAELKNLRALNLISTNVFDLAPLEHLEHLRIVYLANGKLFVLKQDSKK